MSKEKGCKCCQQIWYEDMLDKKWKLCPNCYEYCKPLFDDLKIKDKQIAKLEAKLVEKDKEIEIVKHERDANGGSYMSACKMLTKERQDKISFAVEQLEKVKELVEEKSMTQSPFGTQKIYASDVSSIVDNQINELKEMK